MVWGVRFKLPEVEVVVSAGTGCVQCMAQHSRAAKASGVSACPRASSQQSIPAIFIPHPPSLARSGAPASTLPAKIAIRTRDVSLFNIVSALP
ncbi:MAG TPA: hypothetical protein VNZ44_17110 [Pyrinomonadaceae bacterium]|nr:hypothetical protein [Pyrinomonadaceae bacterium]